MLLRYFRFYLFGYHHYYKHIRLPRSLADYTKTLGYPTFMRYLCATRNIILLRVSNKVHFAVASLIISGFSKSERLADTTGVTKLD